MRKNIIIAIACFLLIDSVFGQKTKGQSKLELLVVNLKKSTQVLGPQVVLADVAEITGPKKLKVDLGRIIVCPQVPPPGESMEISLRHIKLCLVKAGFKDFVKLKGPKMIRVSTAQVEINKAFLRENYANLKRSIIITPLFFINGN